MLNVKSIGDKIHIIENYISEDTASFLCNNIGPTTIKTPDPGVYGGPSSSSHSNLIGAGNPISDYSDSSSYNIAIDILSMLGPAMSKTISDFYNEDHALKSIFYNKMTSGAKNSLHMDNNYIHAEDEKIYSIPNSSGDKSGLLYLSNSYSGGEIHFPLQDLKILPKSGTFIFFEGNEETPHEVLEISDGERHNVVSFFWNSKNIGKSSDDKLGNIGLPEMMPTIEYMKMVNNINEN